MEMDVNKVNNRSSRIDSPSAQLSVTPITDCGYKGREGSEYIMTITVCMSLVQGDRERAGVIETINFCEKG